MLNITTTVRYHLTQIRTAIMKIRDSRFWQERVKRNFYPQWDCRLAQPLWKTTWRLLKKFKIGLPCSPAIPLLSICPKEMKAGLMFIAALFTIAEIRKPPKCASTDVWLRRMQCTYTIGYNLAIKKRIFCHLQ